MTARRLAAFSAVASVLAVAPALALAQASAPAGPFDGDWLGSIDCPTHGEALGYRYDFPVTIERGVLRGERGVEGEANSLRVDGTVAADGSAALRARGRTGDAKYTIGHVARSTPYGFRAAGRFEGSRGQATRTETRPCELIFVRR